jgi:molecular chaperone DnaK (HSP70)
VPLELITEPAAAAYAYGFDSNRFHDYRLMVFDFGGGTLDATVVKVCYFSGKSD